MTPPGEIVWLASFPKSGNTWFRILLANLTAGEKGPADINNLDERGGIASSRHEFEAMTMLDSGLISHDDIDNLRPRIYESLAKDTARQRWVKVHDAYTTTQTGEPLLGRHAARAAVYLVRDPRDVAVSLAYHNSSTIDEAIRLMNAADGALCAGRKGLAPQLRQKLTGWSGHVTSWLEQSDVPVHLVRYEDLMAAPAACFAAALESAGRAATAADIERAIRHSDFAELRRQEEEKGFAERMSRTAPFFRSGRIGGWREILSGEQAGAIVQCHRAAMARLDYEL
jgi:aryl sulfotransferase